MVKEAVKINTLESLEREKQRLKAYCDDHEKRMLNKIIFIKNNYPQIIAEEFLPFTKEKNIKISKAMDLGNEFVLGKFLKMDTDGKNKTFADMIKIAEVAVIRLVNQFFRKDKSQ